MKYILTNNIDKSHYYNNIFSKLTNEHHLNLKTLKSNNTRLFGPYIYDKYKNDDNNKIHIELVIVNSNYDI